MNVNVKNKGWANPISISVLVIPALILFALHSLMVINSLVALSGILVFGLLSASIRVADQW